MSTPSAKTIFNITEEQLDRYHPILDQNTGEVFYQVDSESVPDTTYEVHFAYGSGFTCTCPAGVRDFYPCIKYPTCKHCRFAITYAERERTRTSGEREHRRPILDALLHGNHGFSFFQ